MNDNAAIVGALTLFLLAVFIGFFRLGLAQGWWSEEGD